MGGPGQIASEIAKRDMAFQPRGDRNDVILSELCARSYRTIHSLAGICDQMLDLRQNTG